MCPTVPMPEKQLWLQHERYANAHFPIRYVLTSQTSTGQDSPVSLLAPPLLNSNLQQALQRGEAVCCIDRSNQRVEQALGKDP
jgi:hypothetical protein